MSHLPIESDVICINKAQAFLFTGQIHRFSTELNGIFIIVIILKDTTMLLLLIWNIWIAVSLWLVFWLKTQQWKTKDQKCTAEKRRRTYYGKPNI